MKLREDSPFKKMTEEDIEELLDCAAIMTIEELQQEILRWEPPVVCSIPALRRFLRRLRTERLWEETEESSEALEKFVAAGKSGKLRDGAIEAARQKLFAQAMETDDKETLLEVFRAANGEREEDRKLAVQERLAAAEERKAAVAEENAKIGWRRLEWQRASAVVKLLPKLRELLMAPEVSSDEKVARALGVLMEKDGSGELLAVGAVAAERKILGAGQSNRKEADGAES